MDLRRVAREGASWLPVGIVPILNGAVRMLTYGPRLGEPRASLLSSALDVLLVLAWARHVERRRPVATWGGAARRGILWLALTTASHFGLGAFVFGISWGALASKYDLRAGELWGLVSLAILVAPAFGRWRALARGGDAAPRRALGGGA
jgi:hypothetical protein